MMNLSMMYRFLNSDFSIVYNLLDNWGYTKDSVQLLRASSNFVLTFEKDNSKYILRITPDGLLQKLKDEVSFLSYLAANQVSVNEAIPSQNERLVETTKSSLGTFHAVVFNFIEGSQYEIDDLSEDQFYLWGQALGNLHYHSKQYTLVKSTANEQNLSDLVNEINRDLPSTEKYARREFEFIREWMTSLKPSVQHYGKLHFDFELDNVIWNDDKVSVVDFESSVLGWFAADIAFALRDLFIDKIDNTSPSFKRFIKGYRNKMSITEEEINNIPMFLRFHNLYTFVRLLKTVDIESNPGNPEWLEGLLSKLHLKIEDDRETFKILHT